MENSLSYVIYCWFITTSAHKRIIFDSSQDKISFGESFRFFSRGIHGENKKNGYLNYIYR